MDGVPEDGVYLLTHSLTYLPTYLLTYLPESARLGRWMACRRMASSGNARQSQMERAVRAVAVAVRERIVETPRARSVVPTAM